MHKTLCIGFDVQHADAFAVARHSLQRRMSHDVPVVGIELDAMQRRGIYRRPVERRYSRDGSSVLFDPISERAMSSDCDAARFLTPFLAQWRGWAVFVDCSSVALADINGLFALLDDKYALMCVQAGDADRVLWSNVMAFNCEHQANRALTLDAINGVEIPDLKRFCWLQDSLIGKLPAEWNWSDGVTAPQVSPALVHFTDGGPWLASCQNVPFASEWRRERAIWIAGDGAAL